MMSTLVLITTIISEIGVLLGVIVPIYQKIKKVSEGSKCQLRSEMLRIYYHTKETGVIRQYEYENFVLSYEAYKALGGNSFIDNVYSKVKTFDIVD